VTGRVVDVNVSLGRWPTRRVPLDVPAQLAARLREHGVVEAWAGSLDGLFHKDLASANARLAEQCRARHGVRLVPFGAVNPTLTGWEEDLRRCAEEHRMPGIRLHPNYQGYAADDPRLAELLARAADRGLIVQLALSMEDSRMMHPLLRVPPIDPAPLADLVRRTAGLRLVLLNALNTLRGEPLRELLGAGEVFVEIATLEGVGGVGALLGDIPADRVLFGSHSPLFTFEAAMLKLEESPLGPAPLRAIREGNAGRLLPRSP
jgi:predicted TIM-barrel fold metal-dependent hydrolase